MIDSNINFNEGYTLLIDKKLDWTSFDVVKKIRNITKSKKVGHAGTLDPLASGLLIICTGKHTKKINEFLNLDKTYTGKFVLGSKTPSHDLETEISETKPLTGVNEKKIKEVANSFLGIQLQRPPKYSAVKVNGKRAYELARKDQKVIIEEKEVKINSFEILEIKLPIISFSISCSKGTYIRSLAHDFGKALQSGAHLSQLRRTAIGAYRVADALTPDQIIEQLEGL